MSRGGLFNSSDSSSWSNIGNYSMGLEMNLGYSDNATYGHDTVALGVSEATGSPNLDSQVVATFESTGVVRSLTLGSYDSSRLVLSNVSFSLAPNVSRDLVVGLQSITAKYANGSAVSLQSEPIWTFIDSTIPYIYLPLDACKLSEKTFGLIWNTTHQKYFVDDILHENLVEESSNITFTLGTSEIGGSTVDICLPYSSFDLVMDDPLVPSSLSGIRYFPLMRAANQSQYTLGRTFLQEAYVITNYEQSNFSVFQSKFEDGAKPDIVAIPLASTAVVPLK
ncbi:hypothetical protein HO133_000715 [Letharia lupina]|uniref:Acid protease n=1 Tax=Letharia lupina TaxID=560253 RepID=A0A8H6CFY0_9LECA|nr:uncharacterized protein HO133_000715 [Letharia lupina]KAF6222668.1 hypothetical protein HO133_000715 [Letharia lupina]